MNIQFKTFFKKLALFSICSIVIYGVFLYVSGTFLTKRFKPNLIYRVGHNHLRLNEVKKTSDVDLLFLGSSHAYRGFDTRIFKEAGFTSFNLGSSSQTPSQTLVLIQRYLKRLNPKLVVLEVFPGVFTSDGLESTLDLIVNDKNDFNSFMMVLAINNMKAYNTFMFSLSKDALESDPVFKLNTYQEGGYVSQETLTYNFESKPKPSAIVLKQQHLESFKTILEILKKENIAYVLVQAPITSQMYISYTNIDDFNKEISSYGTYYNFNSSSKLNLNDTLDFYDNHHLNQNGVTAFNAAFLKVLKENYNTLLEKPN